MIHPALSHLSLWDDGWNGYDALAPQEEAIKLASRWHALYDERRQPHWDEKLMVTGDAWGGVVLWQSSGKRKLEVFFDIEGTIEYKQVWVGEPGKTVHIEDGDITSEEEFLALWEWLYGEEKTV